MSILFFFKKNPKDSQEASKISGRLFLAALVWLVVSLFLPSPYSWGAVAIALWILLDATMYLGWVRGYRALEAELLAELAEHEAEQTKQEMVAKRLSEGK